MNQHYLPPISRLWLPALLGVAACLLWPAAGAAPVEILRQANPLSLEWLAVPDRTKTHLRSGFDYNDANYDSGNLLRVEPAGMSFSNHASAWVLFDAQGPGVLTSLWFTGKNQQGQAFLGGKLQFYFDGETTPRLTAPLPDWLERNPLLPAGLAEKSSGGWICYAPIYYARSLKITLEDHQDAFTHRKNGRGEIIPHIYHQFSFQTLAQPVPSSTPASLAQTRTWAESPPPRWDAPRRYQLPAAGGMDLATFTGRGLLLGFRLKLDDPAQEDALLHIWADGESRAVMSVAEFWGHRRQARPQARFQSLLMGVNDAGVYYCHWPMPYAQHLRLWLGRRQGPLGIELQTAARADWPHPDMLHFHAARIQDRTEKGRDIVLLETQGRGHFAGCILELASATLEGDDRFYVDGESFPPGWHGTGTEDYFRCGWYFHGGPLTRPLFGLLDHQSPKLAYRFHLADRVNFNNSVKIGFEHGHQNEYIGPYPGTIFWYGGQPGRSQAE